MFPAVQETLEESAHVRTVRDIEADLQVEEVRDVAVKFNSVLETHVDRFFLYHNV